mmetsp:Transcript_15931/g.33137  ORF Transcript_15931/g.33137 Transcript_15931/m.33137 type:complete len:561 (+) Transcript_15931:17-1699(+)
MKSMLMHSFVLDALDTTGADTFTHFEILINEHRQMTNQFFNELNNSSASCGNNATLSGMVVPSRLKQLVPSVGTFYTHLPLRHAFLVYNAKYGITKRRHICISFNEIRHILNLAQIMAMSHPYADAPGKSLGKGDDVVDNARDVDGGSRQREKDAKVLEAAYTDSLTSPTVSPMPSRPSSAGNKKEEEKSNLDPSQGPLERPRLLEPRDRSESIAIEQALSLLPSKATLPGPKLICFDGDQTLYSDGANFESNPKLAKYLYLLLKHGVTIAVVTAAGYEYQAEKYMLRLSGLLAYFKERKLDEEDLERFYIFGGECNYLLRLGKDYKLHAVREDGPGGWLISTKHIYEAPGNWEESKITTILDKVETSFRSSLIDQNMKARIIRKKRSVGLIPKADEKIPREALDEAVLRIQTELDEAKINLPFCAFNGGRDAWVDVGNKRVGVQVLQSYLGIPAEETLHIGDQFLNTGNDFAARSVCPCVWITDPDETTYILKSILRLAGVPMMTLVLEDANEGVDSPIKATESRDQDGKKVNFEEVERRSSRVMMDVYTGEMISKKVG